MATLTPRSPYTGEELTKLYPPSIQLQHVQILLRHGERTPVSPRFQNTGLRPYWPYCHAARQLRSVVMGCSDSSNWDELRYRRRLETFGVGDAPVIASGPGGEFDGVCQPGELTDKGRETTLALGQRLRHLYVEQLGFMPKIICNADMIYLRATPLPRALESVQQTFWGMYPPSARTASFPPPTIITRTPAHETLYPNEGECRRFAQMSRAFAQRTADRWNDTKDMDYLNKLISKWMPPTSPRVAVDSRPRLSGIMDTVNSTLAHSQYTRLPKEFYDAKGYDIIDKIGVEEWFSGYKESREYRSLGIGALVGDIVSRMIGSVEQNGTDGLVEVGGEDGHLGQGRGGEKEIKFGLSGCHDTTLAGLLASLGVYEGERWPPYTSHIAIELFRDDGRQSIGIADHGLLSPASQRGDRRIDDKWDGKEKSRSWFKKVYGSAKDVVKAEVSIPNGVAKRRLTDLSQTERDNLGGHYVRMRYNDRVMTIPGCRSAGKHLEGDESFCTLKAFITIAEDFIPCDWKQACASNMDKPAFPAIPEPAGVDPGHKVS